MLFKAEAVKVTRNGVLTLSDSKESLQIREMTETRFGHRTVLNPISPARPLMLIYSLY